MTLPGETQQSQSVPPPVVPDYGDGMLAAVLPGAAAALGASTGLPSIALSAARRVCVVLVDGLGAQLLAQAGDDAPFLTSLAPDGDVVSTAIRVGCPTTTATSMGSFGTGLAPGQHGLLGYSVRDPDRGVLLNELAWDPYTDPVEWQPQPTVFSRCVDAGIAVTRIGDPQFAGSGLTEAAHRGGRFVGERLLDARVDAALAALRSGDAPALVYLYWGAVDAAGHAHGWRSPGWREALRRTDAQLARLASYLPSDTALVVTADHGMVDVPHDGRLDIADAPSLRSGVAIFGGEPRFRHLYCRRGAADDVCAAMRAAVGDRAWVVSREEAVAQGWFGPVADRVRARIGDVLVAARGAFAVVDRDAMHSKAMELFGQHGSLTEAEQLVPLLTHRT